MALASGGFPVAVADVLAALKAWVTQGPRPDETIYSVVVNVRLPRVILAVAAGAGLAAAGAGFQALFSNPLATPDTLALRPAQLSARFWGFCWGLTRHLCRLRPLRRASGPWCLSAL